MNLIKFLILAATFTFSSVTTPVLADELKIITPYLGTEENTYINETYGLELTDSQTMKGLYFQSIDSEKSQWNIFIYQTSNINSSDLAGVNFIYDHYFGTAPETKNTIGIGFNYLQMNMQAKNVANLEALAIDLDISNFYLRIGRYYFLERNTINYSFLPWFGGQLNQTRGDGRVDFPGPRAADITIDDDQFFWITGINVKSTIHHFLQLEAKYSVTWDHDDHYQKYSAMANLFVTRNFGFSYRFNDHETPVGKDRYHIFGIAAVL